MTNIYSLMFIWIKIKKKEKKILENILKIFKVYKLYKLDAR